MSSSALSSSEREKTLRECFRLCDSDHDGSLTSEDLERIALLFNSQCADPKKEAEVILQRLDRDEDGCISEDEWIMYLSELFQFMSPDAFKHHCNELKEAVRVYV